MIAHLRVISQGDVLAPIFLEQVEIWAILLTLADLSHVSIS